MVDTESTLQMLQALQEKIVREIDRKEDSLHDEIETAQPGDDDQADVADAIYERGKTLSLINNLRERLLNVEHAIQRVEDGTYGTCEMCGVEIPEARLELIPEAALCVNCASKMETSIRRHRLASEPS